MQLLQVYITLNDNTYLAPCVYRLYLTEMSGSITKDQAFTPKPADIQWTLISN